MRDTHDPGTKSTAVVEMCTPKQATAADPVERRHAMTLLQDDHCNLVVRPKMIYETIGSLDGKSRCDEKIILRYANHRSTIKMQERVHLIPTPR